MSGLISRQAATQTVLDFIVEYLGGAFDEDLQRKLIERMNALPSAQPKPCEDAVPRTSVEYICRKNTVSTNPYEHKYHDKFIQFMDDPEISDFGRWQHSNGFNTALVAVKCDLDKVPSVTPIEALPSAQPEYSMDEWCTDCKEYDQERHCCPRWNRVIRETLKDAQLRSDDYVKSITEGIKATNIEDAYSCGMRNGMRWCISVINGEQPVFETWG